MTKKDMHTSAATPEERIDLWWSKLPDWERNFYKIFFSFTLLVSLLAGGVIALQ